MSTRANVILREGKNCLYFYRHSDGYPEGTVPSLEIFSKWVKQGKIRNNLGQAAGWLIILGAMEYNTIPKFELESGGNYGDMDSVEPPKEWKAGAYEPTTGLHGDIEWLYDVDITNGTIKIQEV